MRLLLILTLSACAPAPVLSWTCADAVAAERAQDACSGAICREYARSIHCTATCIANCGAK